MTPREQLKRARSDLRHHILDRIDALIHAVPFTVTITSELLAHLIESAMIDVEEVYLQALKR